jgi:hypothetical protein
MMGENENNKSAIRKESIPYWEEAMWNGCHTAEAVVVVVVGADRALSGEGKR